MTNEKTILNEVLGDVENTPAIKELSANERIAYMKASINLADKLIDSLTPAERKVLSTF